MPTRDGKHAYTDEEKAEIIAHVLVNVACGRFVSRIFREDDLTSYGIRLPNQDTFWRWVLEDENLPLDAPEKQGLSEKLTRAREHGIEALLDDAIVVAGTTEMGEEITVEKGEDEDGAPETVVKVKRSDMLGHRKLYIETVFKAAQMLKPKKYGAKLDLTSGGEKIGAVQALEEARLRARQVADEKYAGKDGE